MDSDQKRKILTQFVFENSLDTCSRSVDHRSHTIEKLTNKDVCDIEKERDAKKVKLEMNDVVENTNVKNSNSSPEKDIKVEMSEKVADQSETNSSIGNADGASAKEDVRFEDIGHIGRCSDPIKEIQELIYEIVEKVVKTVAELRSESIRSTDSTFRDVQSIFHNISISLVGGGSKDINLESLLTRKDTSATVDNSTDDMHRLFQTTSGISIKKQSDEASTDAIDTLDEDSRIKEMSEEEESEPVENLAAQYDNCKHGDDMSDYSCAECSYNRWRCERDYARAKVKKSIKTGPKITNTIDEVNWEEVLKSSEVGQDEEHPIEDCKPKGSEAIFPTFSTSSDKVANPKERVKKSSSKAKQIIVKTKDNVEASAPLTPPTESKGSLGLSMVEILAASEYFSKYPKQIKKGSTLDDRFDQQDPSLPEGWKYREFGRTNGRTDKEYRAPDFMVFRSKKSIMEYMKFVGIQGGENSS